MRRLLTVFLILLLALPVFGLYRSRMRGDYTTFKITGAMYFTYLTSGRVPYISTGGLITDSASLTFNGTTLTVPAVSCTTVTASGNVTGANLNIAEWDSTHTLRVTTWTSPLSFTTNTASIADADANGTTKGAATFTANDFDAAAGVISLDYTNGQAASGSAKGFLTSANWTTFNGKIANVSEDATPELGGILGVGSYGLLLDSTPDTDHTSSGEYVTMTNGNAGAVAFGDVCFVAADGEMEFADADTVTAMPGLYMADEAIDAAASGRWLRSGIARDSTWTWTPGGEVYVSVTATTGNTLTQVAPSGAGDQVQIVGIALSATTIDFRPDLIIIEVSE